MRVTLPWRSLTDTSSLPAASSVMGVASRHSQTPYAAGVGDLSQLAVLRRVRDRLAPVLQRFRIAGDGLVREVVVVPAVEPAAEDFPDQQAPPRLHHPDVARGRQVRPAVAGQGFVA